MKRFASVLSVALVASLLPQAAHAAALAALANVDPGNDKQAAQVTIGTGAVAVIAGSSPLAGAGSNSQNTAYDSIGKRLFTFDAIGNTLYTINMATGASTGAALGGAAVGGVTDIEYDEGDGVLYAIVNIGADRQLATIGIATGTVALLGSPLAGGSLSTFSQPFDLDAANSLYYFVGAPAAGDTLYAINTANGAIVTSALVTGPASLVNVMGLEWDPGEAAMYALAGITDGDRQLATVNITPGPSFGVVTLSAGGPIAGEGLGTSGNEALDPTGNRYYFTGSPLSGNATLYAINTANGAVADSDLLTFGAGINDVRGLEFDSATLPVELLDAAVE